MKKFLAGIGAVALLAVPVMCAEQTWSGEISDSACGAKHESGTENVPTPPSKQCTLDCVRGGSKFVLVSEGKVYEIANQTFADLPARAGDKVKVTGELIGGRITVSKMETVK
jgi:hypothetical protein